MPSPENLLKSTDRNYRDGCFRLTQTITDSSYTLIYSSVSLLILDSGVSLKKSAEKPKAKHLVKMLSSNASE